MDLIKAPTDNLYKFIALSGMATFVLMCVLIHRHVELAISRSVEYELAINAGLEDLLANYRELKALPAGESDTEKAAREAGIERFLETTDKIGSTIDQTKIKESHFPMLMELYMAVAGLGLSIAAWGFWLWYMKLQRPLDLKLADEVSKLQKSPGKPNKGYWHRYVKG